jgi:hypothetical protein
MEDWSFLTGYRSCARRRPGHVPGTPAQRLAAIANGDGIGATHVTALSLVHIGNTTISSAADTTTTESGGISA